MSDVINGVPRELLERIDRQMIAEGMAPDDELRALLAEQPQASAAPSAPAGERDSYWFSLLMNCAAELETASYCVTDTEAKRVAQSGADYYRDQARASWQSTQSAALFGGDERQHIICVCPDCLAEAQRAQSAGVPSTPGASWRANGEPDPHGDRYNCERAALAMGDLTDDELANGAFMNYDRPLNIEGILAGTHSSPIAWMTAVKDRIRWLSRKLDEALAAAPAQPAAQDQGERYTCIGKGGNYELVGYARLAGELRGMLGGLVPDLAIYRSDTDYFARTRQDFKERMEPIDAASTGQEVVNDKP